MRCVIDTNVMISALINPDGVPGQIMRSWATDQDYILFTCHAQIYELERVLAYPKVAKAMKHNDGAADMVENIKENAEWVTLSTPIYTSPDPFDNYLLSLAVDGRADFIISGDQQGLLNLNPFQGIKILTPKQFWEAL